jgi:hypothetical protein
MDLKICVQSFVKTVLAITASMAPAATVDITFSQRDESLEGCKGCEIHEPFSLYVSGVQSILNPPVAFAFTDGPVIEFEDSPGLLYLERYGPGGAFSVSGSMFGLPANTLLVSGRMPGGELEVKYGGPFYTGTLLTRSLHVDYVHSEFLKGLGLSQSYRGGSGFYRDFDYICEFPSPPCRSVAEQLTFNLVTPEPSAAWLGLGGLALVSLARLARRSS